ncbi:MAG TPA: MarR family transcriptional regulator [Solirubrobacteraceae bacterium]
MRVPDDTLGAWRAFLNAHALATKRINRDLAEAGLPDLTWYDVLWTLRSADGRRLRIRELADAVVLSSTGMTRFVDRLEAEGLVRREAVPGDRRGAYAVLTKEGADLLRRMWPIYARGIAAYFEPAVREGGDLCTALEGIASAA